MQANDISRSGRRLLIATIVMIAINALAFFIGQGVGASMEAGAMAVTIVQVIIATLVAFIVGAVVFLLAARFLPAFARALPWLGLAVGVLSAAAPLTMATDLATGLTLATMHVASGVAWFLATRTTGARHMA